MLRKTKIYSGNFANGEGQRGNFSGYNSKGERIFIHKNQMENIGMKEDKDFAPFYALIDEREIQTRDTNGDLTDVTVKRLQATSVFKTQEELLEAYNEDFTLNVADAEYKQALASKAGLSEKAVEALLSQV